MDRAGFTEQRDDLLESIEQDRHEVRVALRELTGAAELKLDVSERIRKSPLAWTLGGFLIGVWLGSRRARGDASRQRRTG